MRTVALKHLLAHLPLRILNKQAALGPLKQHDEGNDAKRHDQNAQNEEG